MNSQDDLDANLEQARLLIEGLSCRAGDLILLPENFALMAQREAYLGIAEARGQGPVQRVLAQWAKESQSYLIAGSFPILCSDPQRCYTTSLAFDPQGQLLESYDKLHLFDVDVADGVGRYRESDSFKAGSRLACFDTKKARVGLSICFDLRFSALYQLLRKQGCDIVTIPAAFTAATGSAHWQQLIQARAIENQCYVVAANQCGQHGEKRQTWGHSMIVDPWGTIVASCEQDIATISVPVDFDLIDQVRRNMPLAVSEHLQISWK
ncbi:carbon-nitrogen hydrolase family protein [Alginatibacterium sediminis]|uniref:Carbon-nitrogen hydrolase family protein n=2 Tax=Alginatibacterium sediminis TaxID=2164068 RepID=A0A420ELJ3_9ALTE|nr:carbon-nitrogen hydrolase family protein [Alginatibacterium sediminis]